MGQVARDINRILKKARVRSRQVSVLVSEQSMMRGYDAIRPVRPTNMFVCVRLNMPYSFIKSPIFLNLIVYNLRELVWSGST